MGIISFEDLQKANVGLKTTDIRGKEYVEVNQRIKAFRKLFPDGTIETDIISMQDGLVVMKATASISGLILATGHAYEREGTTNINKTSFIENCETSAVGRCLAILGIGVDLSIASAEEVENAIEAQNMDLTISPVMETTIRNFAESKGVDIQLILDRYEIKELSELKAKNYASLMESLKKTKGKE